jgi:hypothetical protein
MIFEGGEGQLQAIATLPTTVSTFFFIHVIEQILGVVYGWIFYFLLLNK